MSSEEYNASHTRGNAEAEELRTGESAREGERKSTLSRGREAGSSLLRSTSLLLPSFLSSALAPSWVYPTEKKEGR